MYLCLQIVSPMASVRHSAVAGCQGFLLVLLNPERGTLLQ